MDTFKLLKDVHVPACPFRSSLILQSPLCSLHCLASSLPSPSVRARGHRMVRARVDFLPSRSFRSQSLVQGSDLEDLSPDRSSDRSQFDGSPLVLQKVQADLKPIKINVPLLPKVFNSTAVQYILSTLSAVVKS